MWPAKRLSDAQRDWIKLVALALMTVDHIGAYIFGAWVDASPDTYELFRGAGRLAMPLFAVLFFESAVNAKSESFIRRATTLLVFAVLTQAAWEVSFIFHPNREDLPVVLNILFGFSLAYCLLYVLEENSAGRPIYKWSLFALMAICFVFIDFGLEVLALCVGCVAATRKPGSDWSASVIFASMLAVFYLSYHSIVPFVGLLAFAIPALAGKVLTRRGRIQFLARNRNFSSGFYMLHVPAMILIASALISFFR